VPLFAASLSAGRAPPTPAGSGLSRPGAVGLLACSGAQGRGVHARTNKRALRNASSFYGDR
jgi:hypothetical protein